MTLHIGQLFLPVNFLIQLSQKKCLHGIQIVDFLLVKHIGQIVPSSPYPSIFIAPFAFFLFHFLHHHY